MGINCFECGWQRDHYQNAMIAGYCSYFRTVGKTAREIPAEHIEADCKFYKVNKRKAIMSQKRNRV